jgi:hypothetical protein
VERRPIGGVKIGMGLKDCKRFAALLILDPPSAVGGSRQGKNGERYALLDSSPNRW